MEDLSLLTRAKLARELLLAPNQRRGAPCLRKLVLWSNLLGTGTGTGTPYSSNHHHHHHLAIDYQVQEHHPSHRLNDSNPPRPSQRPLDTAPESISRLQQNEAEFDWFEHLMDEIDDSDSESDSSDHTPDRHQHQRNMIQPPVDLAFKSPEISTTPALIKQISCRSKRAWSSDLKGYCRQSNELGRRTRRRLLSISNNIPQPPHRKQLGKRLKKRSSTLHSSPSAVLPYWGFIAPPHLPANKLDQVTDHHPSNSSIREDEEDGYNSLPSLLSTKSSYLFESIDPVDTTPRLVQDHDFGFQHPFISSKTSRSLGPPELNSIDFSPYDFLISTTSTANQDQGNSILQVKYLVGNLGLGKYNRAKSYNHLTTNNDSDGNDGKNIHIRVGKQLRRHHSSSSSSSSRGLIVKKIHVVFNHLLDFHHSHSDLYQNYYPHRLLHPFDCHLLSLLRSKSSPFAWKVYGLHMS